MTKPIRWGILSTGAIAKKFTSDLQYAKGAVLQAVGSRSQASADAFGAEYGIPNRHASYEALVQDPEVDVVYIGTPNNLHKPCSMLALNAGKSVLCEKPFTINRAEAEAVIERAQEQRCFIMEAMWTRFNPAVRQAKAWIEAGRIGEVRMVHANFGFRMDDDERGRLRDPELGGGALLDVGVYPISLASHMIGKHPVTIFSAADLGPTDVDEQSAYLLKYGKGELAVLSSAICTTTNYDAYIEGTEGMIQLHSPFWCPRTATLTREEEEPVVSEHPFPGHGMHYQAEEVMRCMGLGLLESPVMPHRQTLEVMEILDHIRTQNGIRYPME